MTQPWTTEEESLGFSGTRNEPTILQKQWLVHQVIWEVQEAPIKVKKAHHGCCQGADAFFHRAIKACLDVGLEQIVLHPPSDRSREMEITEWDMANCVWYPRKAYLDRNRDIALTSATLLALPNNPDIGRPSGTWNTIHRAQEFNRTVKLCMPNGKLRIWDPSTKEWRDEARP